MSAKFPSGGAIDPLASSLIQLRYYTQVFVMQACGVMILLSKRLNHSWLKGDLLKWDHCLFEFVLPADAIWSRDQWTVLLR